jgi:hypothetical protein
MPKFLMPGLVCWALSACANTSAPVPVRGDVARLQGQWVGEYSSVESGRSGSIVFTLKAGSDTAYGDVVMVPAEMVARPFAFEQNINTRPPGYQPEVLAIRFVQINGNKLIGELEPYKDPACGCELSTTFTGKLNADVLEGTYLSYHREEQRTIAGHWRATRTRPAVK